MSELSTNLTPSSSPDTPKSVPGTMSIWDHLEELRMRLLRSVIVLALSFGVAIIFTSDIIDYLAKPYTDLGGQLLNLEPTGSIVMYFRVALMSAGIISVPFITYQLLMFIMPGLTNKEKRWVLTAIPFATAFFLIGVAFAWFVMLPTAFEFLYSFQDDVFSNEWTAQRYFAVLTSMLFWIGVAFEMPVVLYVLAKVGLIGPRQLIQGWRFAVVGIAIAAAVITPTADPFNMLLVMAPLLVLYVISIILVTFAARSRQQTDQKPI
jgi:sec-independent protein translocase protein TatC